MKIALYYPWVYLTSGAERLILEICTKSRFTWRVFTNRFDKENTFPELKNVDIVELSPRISVNRTFIEVIKAAFVILKQKLDVSGYDVLVVLCEGVGDLAVFRNSRQPVICICLTPLRPVYDIYYKKHFLKNKGWFIKAQLKVFGCLFGIVARRAWKRYARIFCISEEVKKRVIRGNLAREEKLDILYPGIYYSRFIPTDEYDRYFLLPGRIMWTKNIELGIEGFKVFLDTYPQYSDFRLIITGIVDEKSKSYFEELKDRSGEDRRIRFIVHPSDEELFRLYQRCYAVLFTAFNEDWGIVPLEGMGYGKPVISVNRGGPRETVVDGKNGLLCDPDPAAFSNAMYSLASDPVKVREMGKFGREFCKKFDWCYFINGLDDYLEKAFGRKGEERP